MMSRLTAAALASLLLIASIGVGRAADASTTTLESDLTPEIATDTVTIYQNAVQSPPGFEPFQALYLRFETVRKWEAYLDATAAAHLNDTSGTLQAIDSAVKTLHAAGITRVSVATAAIEKLAGVGDWHAADPAQAQLVIDELGVLLSEISDPTQRIRGQLVLAGVELDTTAPEAARIRVATALRDLHSVPDPALQLQYAQQMFAIILALKDPQAIEISSEIVGGVTTAAERTTITDEIARRLPAIAGDRLAIAGADDPLGLAWSYNVHRLDGDGVSLDQTIADVSQGIDPLPVAITIASGVEPAQRLAICAALVTRSIAAGNSIRGLNLLRTLPAEDCGPDIPVALGSALAAQRLDAIAAPLLDAALGRLEQNGTLPAQSLTALETSLVAIGAVGLIDNHAATLERLLQPEAYRALRGRAAVTQLLHGGAASPDGASGYAAAATMAALLTDNAQAPAPKTVAPDDLPLFQAIGAKLGVSPDAQARLVAFLASDASLEARLALATGITSAEGFRLADDELTVALQQLDASAGAAPHAGLSASLGKLDLAELPTDPARRDDLLRRLARHAAWTGDIAAATAFAQQAKAADSINLDIVAIDGVLGDFDRAVEAIRAVPNAAERVHAFRFLARARAEDLDILDWLRQRPATASVPPVKLVKASTAAAGQKSVLQTDALTVSVGANPPGRLSAPPMASLDIESSDVLARAPYPTGGAAGVVVGGEGRYVRLARFESPSFDGQRNNGVRDYVYQQNKTITPEFIFLNSGVFTLADVIAGIGRSDVGAITQLPRGVVRINRPLAIGPDATLVVSGQEVDELQINGTLGAYIVNAGKLFVMGAKVVAFDTDRNGPAYVDKGKAGDRFRPFILSWSASETYVADSELVAMGYSAGRSYGLSLTSGPADDFYARAQSKAPTGIVVNNSFDNSYYGFYAYEAEGAQVVGNEYRNSIIYGIDPHDRSRHLNLSLNAAYGTFKKHGIIISREVDDSTIAGNLTFDNHGSGIMLDRASVGTVITGNTVRNNGGDGVAVFESPCTLIGINDISFNKRSGVLVRNSWDVTVASNRINNNKAAGVQGYISDLTIADGSEGRNFEVDPYQPFATVSIRNNAIAANGAGIQTAGVSAAEIFENRFRDQSKRLFGGDLDGLNAVLLQNSGKLPTLVTTNCRPVVAAPARQCVLTEIGAVLPPGGAYPTGASANYCLGDAASPQAQAFTGGAL